jgi:protein TonB
LGLAWVLPRLLVRLGIPPLAIGGGIADNAHSNRWSGRTATPNKPAKIFWKDTTAMSSITIDGKTDPQGNALMNTRLARHDAGRRRLWMGEAAAYVLAILAHLGLWQLYQNSSPPPPPQEPPVIEVQLVTARSPAPTAASAPQPPQAQTPPPPALPQVQPPPKPKPVPKVEKPPVPKKPVEVKPRPQPVPKPRPVPKQEVETPPTPAHEEAPPAPIPREEAPPAPAAETHHKAAPKPPAGEDEENNRYTKGTVGGYRMRYPATARERGLEGTVTVKIHVSADGDIESVSVVGSSGHEMLDDSAVEMVKDASHVKPCYRGDKPVDCTFTQSVRFKLNHE